MSSVQDDQASVKSEDSSAPRVKFLCSYGGKILPRPHDGQLRYVGGDTRLVAVSRNISLTELMAKLTKLFGPDLWLKYQLPNQELDALISVTCDEDVENMMDEYKRNEAGDGGSRLRGFLFPAMRSLGPELDSPDEQPKSPEQKYAEALNGVRPLVKLQSEFLPATFQLPDYLFGSDPASYRHQEEEGFPPPSPLSPSPPYEEASVISPHPIGLSHLDYSRHHNPLMDTGVRSPALTTSAIGPLMPNPPLDHLMMRDSKQAWNGGIIGDRRGERREKCVGDINLEANHFKLQRDVGVEVLLSTASLKDRVAPQHLEGSPVDSHLTIERPGKSQSKNPLQSSGFTSFERQKPEEVHADSPATTTRKGHPMGGGGRPYMAMELKGGLPNSNLGTVEMQRALVQLNFGGNELQRELPESTLGAIPGFDGDSGESDQEFQNRMECQTVKNVPQSHPIHTSTTDGQADGFIYQDVHGFYRSEENKVMQQQKLRPMDVLPSQPPQQTHHLERDHFQQGYWQAWDPQEQLHEPIIMHSLASLQRIRPPFNSNLPHSGAAASHHHRVPSAPNSVRTGPWVDAWPSARLPSPFYRQVSTAAIMRNDPQQLSRAANPLLGHLPGNGLPIPSRYGARVVQILDNRAQRSTINQQPVGVLVSPHIDLSDPYSIYEQGGGQVHYPDKFPKGNHEAPTGQVQYQERVIQGNHDSLAGQMQFVEENVKATHQYTQITSFKDTHSVHAEGYPHQDSSVLHHRQ